MQYVKKFRVIFLESEGFYSDLLDTTFFYGCDLSFDGARKYKDFKYFSNFDLVVYTIYSSCLYNKIIFDCYINEVKTLLLFDGIAEFSNFTNNKRISKLNFDNYHPIIADNLAVVGESAKKYFEEYGVKVLNHLPPRVNTMSDGVYCCNDQVFDFLITTANTAYYNDSEKGLLLKLLEAVVAELSNLGVSFCFRVFDESISEYLKISEDINFIDGDFNSCLKRVRCVVTTPSSIMLDSMVQGRPVGLLLYRDSPLFIQSGWSIFLGSNLSDTFLSMMSKDKKRMTFQKCQVRENLQSFTAKNAELSKSYFDRKEVVDFYNQNLNNLISSKFNINFEYFFRKLYWKLKRKRIFKFIKKIISLF